mgnify:CR=1 FL=1
MNKATSMNLKINGNIKSFDDSSMTVEALVRQLNLLGKRIAIEKNGMIISKSEFQNNPSQFSLDLSSISSGIYFVKIADGRSDKTFKIIVNK